jgi:hypothetical protein
MRIVKMSARRIKLNLPSLEQYSPGKSVVEHSTSSRNEKAFEISSSSEASPMLDYAGPRSLNSLKSGPSTTKLKEILAKTSEKLSAYTTKPDQSLTASELIEKNKQISELKKTVSRLENEL